jgi:hypothetical protein
MIPKTASELSLIEAIPLPAPNTNPEQVRAAIGGADRARPRNQSQNRENSLNGREQP